MVDEVFKELNIKFIKVRVSKSSKETIENCYYFNHLYKEIEMLAGENYFDNIISPKQFYFKNFKNWLGILLGIVKEKIGVTSDFACVLNSDEESILFRKKYICEVLSKNNIVIGIENIHNIDSQSMELLGDISKRLKSNIKFIFEYTFENTIDSSQEKNNFMNFIKEVQTFMKIEPIVYKVEKLDFNEAIKLIEKKESSYSAIKKSYDESEGNLMYLIINQGINSGQNNPIEASLEQLNKNQKLILYILYLNESKLLLDDLKYILKKSKMILEKEYSENIIFLIKNNFIKKTDSKYIQINHDSILESLDSHKTDIEIYNAYKLVVGFYEKKYTENQQSEDIINHLFFLYVKFNDENLFKLFDPLENIIRKYKYPEEIINILQIYEEKFSNNKSELYKCLLIFIIKIACENQLVDIAQSYLDKIYDPDIKLHIAIKAKILSMKSNNSKSVSELEELINIETDGTRLKLFMELCLLSMKMEITSQFEIEKNISKLISNEAYTHYVEYAYLLKNSAEYCYDVNDAENLFKKSIKILEKNDLFDKIPRIELSLSNMFAYSGDLDKAKMHFPRDISKLKITYVLNNKCAIKLLEGNIDSTIEENLNDAILLTSNEYELVILHSNLMIYYILNDDIEKASFEAAYIESVNYDIYNYEEFLHILFQNLLFYYKKIGHESKIEDLTNKIHTLYSKPEINTFTKNMISSIMYKHEDSFFKQFDYRVDFLGYWDIPIPKDL